ncbi:MAG: SDR family oxidoreductase [Proteobacteria bacterium]|nr:SDR family oxidoreductase [Pseudomonadota bacterium]
MICDLSNKVAVVTGAGLRGGDTMPGFGPTIAMALARQGAKVAVLDLKAEDSERTVYEINKKNGEALAYSVDITDVKTTQSIVRKIQSDFGRIDILVNNAGVCMENPLLEVSEEQWDMLSNINGKGAFFVAQETMRVMCEQKQGGVLIFVASDSARKGGQIANVGYTYAKAGEVGVMKSFARVGAEHKIRSVAILPGPGKTEMTRHWPEEKRNWLVNQMFSKKLVEPQEIARAVLFAADPVMESLTGCCIDVNAGLWIG